MKVAILYICTGEYAKFWPDFYRSAKAHLLHHVHKRFFVFSDRQVEAGDDVSVIYQDSLGWPFNTMYRFRMFLRIRSELESFSHVVFLNANCVIQNRIEPEEFFVKDADLIACRHPGFFDKPPSAYTYERRPQSKACIAQGDVYRAGGLMGGSVLAFLEASEEIARNIDADLRNGLVALWHDESHWNAYLHNRLPELGRVAFDLSPGFLYPEGWKIPFEPRILLREKSKVIDVDGVKGHAKVEQVAAQRGVFDRVVDRIRSISRTYR